MEEKQTVIGSRLGIPSAPPKKADGGPAFPHTKAVGSALVTEGGLSLRDYFAAKALQGMLADPSFDLTRAEAAQRCYLMADVMLEARK